MLPPESATVESVAREIGVGVSTLERWRSDALSRPARERAWTAAARFEAVLTTAPLDEAGKSAWCREHGVYPQELAQWRQTATQLGRHSMPEMSQRQWPLKQTLLGDVMLTDGHLEKPRLAHPW